MRPTKLLIDGDLLVYRVGFATDRTKDGVRKVEPVKQALRTLDKMISRILCKYPEVPYTVYLSGPSADNYRHKYAVTAPYKGNRDKPKPEHYEALRDYLATSYVTHITTDTEADDAIATKHMELYVQPAETPVIVSIDKDFDQLPGWHYNFLKKEQYWVTAEEGMEWLFVQVLTGDSADNIIGIRGVGEKTARKLFSECATVSDYYRACLKAFMSRVEITDTSLGRPRKMRLGEAIDRVKENLTLAYLQRKPGDLPPDRECWRCGQLPHECICETL